MPELFTSYAVSAIINTVKTRYLVLFSILIFCFTALLGVGFAFLRMPWVDLSPLEQYKAGKPSILLDDEGIEWARFELDRRDRIKFNQFPLHLKQAFLAAEDREFFSHFGISFKGIARSLVVNLWRARRAQGASTITQQLVRLLFFDNQRTFSRKIKEQLMSLAVEQQFSKEQILTAYLNHVYFGCGIYGVEAAAQRFWGISANEVSVAQAAVLAGIMQSPAMYCPLIKPQASIGRRNVVLKQMLQTGFVTAEEYEAAKQELLHLKEDARIRCAPHLKEAIRQQLEERFGRHMLYQGGLRIQTTINKRMQLTAQDLFSKHFKKVRAQVHKETDGALISLHAPTGEIKVLIGGTDFAHSQFNRALQAQRQLGSIFKPLVYAQALMDGHDLAEMVTDEPIDISLPNGSTWSPHNYNEQFEGPMTLARALIVSCNTITVKTILDIGPAKVSYLGQRAGLRIRGAYPSLSLGCIDGTLRQAAGLMAVFANDGNYQEPHFIKWVKDEWDSKIYEYRPRHTAVIPPRVAHQIASVLQIAMQRYARLNGVKVGYGCFGKTGTTNDFRTCWFSGAAGQFVTSLYLGRDDNSPLGFSVYPSRVAFPLWHALYEALFQPLVKPIIYDSELTEQTINAWTGEPVGADHVDALPLFLPRNRELLVSKKMPHQLFEKVLDEI